MRLSKPRQLLLISRLDNVNIPFPFVLRSQLIGFEWINTYIPRTPSAVARDLSESPRHRPVFGLSNLCQ